MGDAALLDLSNVIRSSFSHEEAKTILITGCTSGIGLYAVKLLRVINAQHRLILVGRTLERAKEAEHAVRAVEQTTGGNLGEILTFACDQSSIESVHEFSECLRNELNGDKLDIICLNAAMIVAKDSPPQFTEDDLEITFQTNHLAPFLIANLIHDLIREGGRIVVTSSGLHVQTTFGDFKGMTSPRTKKAMTRFETLHGQPYHYKETYATSKLCNTAFALALDRRLRKESRQISVNSFTPGLVTSTGLFRNQNQWLMPFFSFTANHIGSFGSTVEWGGGALAWMVLSDEAGSGSALYYKTPPGSSHKSPTYGETFIACDVSQEAACEKNQDRLWELSAELARIRSDMI